MAENPVAEEKKFKAVLIGGTGATGSYLVAELLKSKDFEEVVSLGRRKLTLPEDVSGVDIEAEEKSGRFKQEIVDMENITVETFGGYFENKDVFFTCLGTNVSDAGSTARFRHIDFDYNFGVAKVAAEKKVRVASLLSSIGANKDSYFTYMKVKGEIEHELGKLEFPQLEIFRPGLLGRGKNARLREKFYRLFTKELPVRLLATGMYYDAVQKLKSPAPEKPEQNIYGNTDIYKFVKAHEEGSE